MPGLYTARNQINTQTDLCFVFEAKYSVLKIVREMILYEDCGETYLSHTWEFNATDRNVWGGNEK